jgi:hypothetical protein
VLEEHLNLQIPGYPGTPSREKRSFIFGFEKSIQEHGVRAAHVQTGDKRGLAVGTQPE